MRAEWRLRRAGESWGAYGRRQLRGLALTLVVTAPLYCFPVLYATGWHVLHRRGVADDGVRWRLPWPWFAVPWDMGQGAAVFWRMPWCLYESGPDATIEYWKSSGDMSPAYRSMKSYQSRRYPLIVTGTGTDESYCSIVRFRNGTLSMACSLHEGSGTLLMYGRSTDEPLFERTFRSVAGAR